MFFWQKQYEEVVELDRHDIASKNMFHLIILLAILDKQEEIFILGIAKFKCLQGQQVSKTNIKAGWFKYMNIHWLSGGKWRAHACQMVSLTFCSEILLPCRNEGLVLPDHSETQEICYVLLKIDGSNFFKHYTGQAKLFRDWIWSTGQQFIIFALKIWNIGD